MNDQTAYKISQQKKPNALPLYHFFISQVFVFLSFSGGLELRNLLGVIQRLRIGVKRKAMQ